MRWMLLEDKDTLDKYLWNGEDSGEDNILINITSFKVIKDAFDESILTTEYRRIAALDSQIRAAWDQNSRTATAGGKIFEVLASGRV